MKTKLLRFGLLPLLLGSALLNTSFVDWSPLYWDYIPVYMKRADLDHSVSFQSEVRVMKNIGKIYYQTPYIFVNERYKGVHVINNINPQQPVGEGFIVAPGCVDMAVKGNTMYLDNAVDLVAFDLVTKQVTKRIRDVFPEPASPNKYMFYLADEALKDYVLIEWKKNPDME